MAGITDGAFCRGFLTYGFDMVTLGGYNADAPTINAARKILARGRPAFDVAEEEFINHIQEQTVLINDQDFWNGVISVNLRSIMPEPIIEISKLKTVDEVENNAHCRQPEITDLVVAGIVKKSISSGKNCQRSYKRQKSGFGKNQSQRA
jgi:TIM-barrel protein